MMNTKIILFLLLTLLVSCSTSVKREKILKNEAVPYGHIERLFLPSKHVPTRAVDIWFPDNYPSLGKYNVLYMHDGGALFGLEAPSFLTDGEWMMDEKISNLMTEGKIEPTIVVGIHNIGQERAIEYFPQEAISDIDVSLLVGGHLDSLAQKGRADNYLRFIVEELKPYIDSELEVNTSKESTYIMGSSMGALISMYAICEYPDLFNGAGCLSTHWVGQMEQNDEIPNAIIKYMASSLPSSTDHKMYFSTGNQGLDSLYPIHQQKVDSLMEDKGFKESKDYKSEYFKGEDHKVSSWVKNLNSPVLFLMGK
ncbi:MAG: alpha/beta hydrolase-fold protein [Rikenellaceae bacterium]